MKKNYGIDISILNAPWLIEPAAMDHLAAALRHLNMEEAMRIYQASDPDENDHSEHYELRDGGVAVLHISGTLTPEEGFFARLFGGSGTLRTYAAIKNAVTAADNDPAVTRKVMKINSPGGTVAGAFESVHFLHRSGAVKPLYAYADGQMTSAAQLLAAAARQIAAPKTAQVGSIGVLWAHVNEEKLNERIGIDVTYLHAGKYKAFGNPDEALSDEAKTYFQDRLYRTYSFFIDDMAAYRDMTVEDVTKAADGRVYLAEQGKEAGLVDVIVNDFDEFLTTLTQEDLSMDVNELKTKHPELYAQVMDLGKKQGKDEAAANAPDPEAAKKQARDDMLSVITAVFGQEMADQIKKITDLGLTAAQLEAARTVLAPAKPPAGKEDETQEGKQTPTRQQILDGINAAGNAPLNAGTGQAPADPGKVDFMSEVEAWKKDHPNDNHMAAVLAVRKIHPQAYEKWIEAENKR
ncbi:MAG: S49 family peptidase [Desulfotignum sp.]|nr:S49 family peptidase [Desulfotignum sp.]